MSAARNHAATGRPEVERIARLLLDQDPDPLVRRLILRDVLGDPSGSMLTDGGPQVRALAAEQRPDGSWGPFHSRSTRLKQRIPSTEVGVARALTLGLDASHPVLSKAHANLVDLLEGRAAFPDYAERNDRWATGVKLFVSSTLAQIDPAHPSLVRTRVLWKDILLRTFRTGSYSEQDEIDAHRALTGATMKDSYLVLRSRYHLILLSAAAGALPAELVSAYIGWVWRQREGIGYLSVPLDRAAPTKNPGPLDRWFASHELLAKHYPGQWRPLFQPYVPWFWDRLSDEGRWDFGPRAAAQHYFPLSDDWTTRVNRRMDWTVRVLRLLSLYYDA